MSQGLERRLVNVGVGEEYPVHPQDTLQLDPLHQAEDRPGVVGEKDGLGADGQSSQAVVATIGAAFCLGQKIQININRKTVHNESLKCRIQAGNFDVVLKIFFAHARTRAFPHTLL